MVHLCLLYTSPSPRDLSTSRMPSSAYYGNVTETLKDSGKKTSEEAVAAFSYMSLFGEVALDEAYGLSLGVEFTPDAVGLANADRIIHSAARGGPSGNTTSGVDADLGVQDIKALMS